MVQKKYLLIWLTIWIELNLKFMLRLLFGGGINEQFLRPDIHFSTIWPKEIPEIVNG